MLVLAVRAYFAPGRLGRPGCDAVLEHGRLALGAASMRSWLRYSVGPSGSIEIPLTCRMTVSSWQGIPGNCAARLAELNRVEEMLRWDVWGVEAGTDCDLIGLACSRSEVTMRCGNPGVLRGPE